MDKFTKSLTPLLDEAMAKAIAKHIESMHTDFALLAELTKDAKSYEEIAMRFVDRGLIDTHNPSDSVIQYQNVCEEFVSNVADLLWIQERDELWHKDPVDNSKPSAALQAYLAQQEGK